MKVKPIPRHTVQHMWAAYVKRILSHNSKSEYWVKYNNGKIHAIYYRTPTGQTKEFLSYELFRNIIERFMAKAKQAVMNAESIEIPHCGFIAGKRIERDFRSKKKTIDWKRTTAAGYTITQTPEGPLKKYNKVYYQLQDEYCRIGWFKPTIVNISIYSFLPTESSSKTHTANPTVGFKEEFSHNIMKDQFIKYKYIFCPIRDIVPNTNT